AGDRTANLTSEFLYRCHKFLAARINALVALPLPGALREIHCNRRKPWHPGSIVDDPCQSGDAAYCVSTRFRIWQKKTNFVFSQFSLNAATIRQQQTSNRRDRLASKKPLKSDTRKFRWSLEPTKYSLLK